MFKNLINRKLFRLVSNWVSLENNKSKADIQILLIHREAVENICMIVTFNKAMHLKIQYWVSILGK